MKVIKNGIIPLKGYKAMTVWPFIFARDELDDVTLNHEKIHGRQQLEMLWVLFFVWYVVEWAVKLFVGMGNAYRRISFEREAYGHEAEPDYLKRRKMWAWWRYVMGE